jgi:serine/threonine-protein kinase RsbW
MTEFQLQRLTRPARVEFLPEFVDFVHAATHGTLTEADLNQLDLVVEELLVNVARYAYPRTEAGEVELACAVDGPARVLVQISDQGRPFNPLDSNPPDFSRGLAERQVGGLGIFLVKSIAESISYERSEPRNTVSFVFCGSGDSKK